MRGVAVAVVLFASSSCGSSSPMRSDGATPKRDQGRAELVGCFRVDSKADGGRRVRGEVPPRALRPFAHGTIYCLEADRYSFRPPDGNWNTVLTRWSVDAIWSEPNVRRAGVAWTAPARPALHSNAGICEIDPEACRVPEHADAPTCPITFVRDGERFRLEGAATSALVPLEPDQARRARLEIARLPSVDRECARAAAALKAAVEPVSIDLEEWGEPPTAGFAASDAGALADLASCRALLRAKQTFERTGHGELLRSEGCEMGDGRAFLTEGRVTLPPKRVREKAPPKTVVCDESQVKIGDECVRLCAPPPAGAPSAALSANSIPQSWVLMDECALGQTPVMRTTVTAGAHRVRFVHPERGHILRSVELRAGDHKTVAVKFEHPGE